MKRLSTSLFVSCILLLLLLLPDTQAGGRSAGPGYKSVLFYNTISAAEILKKESEMIYDSLNLRSYGLRQEAFEYAYTGYKHLLEKGVIENPGVITVCDFSQSSKKKRLYLIDIDNYELLLNTYVAHGKNSGGEYAGKFSNKPRSHQSSLGFYITKNSYYGEHGLALRIDGLEKGINDKALNRNIVIHGASYANPDYLNNHSYLGRSFGCPAVPKKDTEKLIKTIKNGTCFFIYHPSNYYLTGSKILNG